MRTNYKVHRNSYGDWSECICAVRFVDPGDRMEVAWLTS